MRIRSAYVEYDTSVGYNTFKARVGRQDFAFDLQRSVSLRDGPNVRQSFDGAWADWEAHRRRVIGFLSLPVQYEHGTVFDDALSLQSKLDMLRVERHVLGTDELSAYYARDDHKSSTFLDASGNEHRNVRRALRGARRPLRPGFGGDGANGRHRRGGRAGMGAWNTHDPRGH